MKTRLTSLLAVVVLVLVMAVPALAQTATQNGYSSTAGQVQTQVDDESSTPVAATPSGGGGGSSLPFTGLDVALLAAGGVLLAAAGLCMRHLTRAHGHSPA
jgi:hypothetical protein